MKIISHTLVATALLLLCQNSEATVVLYDDFGGLSSSTLNGTSPDTGTGTWTAASTIMANGSMAAGSASAWLPYTFGSGTYEVKLDINTTYSNSTAFLVVSFINSNTPWGTGQFNTVTGTYSTFGLRRNLEADFWAGTGNAGNVVMGSLSSGTSLIGTLRLVLNTTGTNWTVDTYYTPSGGSEITFDMNGASAGTTYTYATNPSTFKGVGFSSNTGSAGSVDNFTLSTVPEPSTAALLLLGGASALCIALRRRLA